MVQNNEDLILRLAKIILKGFDTIEWNVVGEYCRYLMSMQLSFGTPRNDVGILDIFIQKQLSRGDINKKKSILFSEYLHIFMKNRFIKNKWEIVYFLYCLFIQEKYCCYDRPCVTRQSFLVPGKRNIEAKSDMPENVSSIDKSLVNWKHTMNCLEYVPESDIIREIVYVLNGFESKSILYDNKVEGYVIDPSIKMTKSNKFLVDDILKCPNISRKINGFLKTSAHDINGSIFKVYYGWIKDELNEYYKKIAELETMTILSNDKEFIMKKGLGLMSLYVLLREPSQRINLVYDLIKHVKGSTGTDIIRKIFESSRTGSSSNQYMLRDLLSKAIYPILTIMNRWIQEGVLDDPFNEFFISINDRQDIEEDSLWKEKIEFHHDNSLFFMNESLSKKTFVVGKSLLFMNRIYEDKIDYGNVSNENITVVDYDFESMSKSLSAYDLNSFESFVETCYRRTAPKLLLLLIGNKYNLNDHIYSIKKYLLCLRGDFIQALIDGFSDELSKPSNQLYHHNLFICLNYVIKQTLYSNESSFIYKCIDARLSKSISNSPQIQSGWEAFCLDYCVAGPLRFVFTSKITSVYHKIFRFIWRLKRCDSLLSSIWTEMYSMGRIIDKHMFQYVDTTFRLNVAVVFNMKGFINSLIHYTTIDVIEDSWNNFSSKMEEYVDLDIYITHHSSYLERILICGTFSGKDQSTRDLQQKLFQILQIIYIFIKSYSLLNQLLVENNEFYKNMHTKRETRGRRGEWKTSDAEENEVSDMQCKYRDKINLKSRETTKLYRQFSIEVDNFRTLLQKENSTKRKLASYI